MIRRRLSCACLRQKQPPSRPGLYRLSLTAFSDQLSTVSERVLTIETSATGDSSTDGAPDDTDATASPDGTDGDDDKWRRLQLRRRKSSDMLLLGGLLLGLAGINAEAAVADHWVAAVTIFER